ncbi:MAG: CPBP family intramembrane metalloprotease [Ruminococcaceae bacterium]|nr:CPBP family intramembrane metalloprotease [Oscillospiraceae bacterium]
MKCPQCNQKIYLSDDICPQCGYDIKKYRKDPKTKVQPKAVLRVIVAVVLFISLMFAAQSCVIAGYSSSLMLQSGFAGSDMSGMTEEAIENFLLDIIEKVNSQTVLIVLIANLITILAVCLIFTLRRKNPAEEMYLRRVNIARIPTFAIFGMALNVFVSVTLSFIPFPESIIEAFDAQYAGMYGGNIFLEIFSVAIVTGITEELLFRGIALKRLSPAMGRWPAIIVSSILFGLAHGTPIAIGYATLLGIIFGYICTSYKSVVLCIVCHVFFNLSSYILPLDNMKAMIALYIMSIAVIILCVYRSFIRRPTFYDMVFDKNGDYEYINETEEKLIEEVKEARDSDDIDMPPERLEEIFTAWEKLRADYKNDKKKKK